MKFAFKSKIPNFLLKSIAPFLSFLRETSTWRIPLLSLESQLRAHLEDVEACCSNTNTSLSLVFQFFVSIFETVEKYNYAWLGSCTTVINCYRFVSRPAWHAFENEEGGVGRGEWPRTIRRGGQGGPSKSSPLAPARPNSFAPSLSLSFPFNSCPACPFITGVISVLFGIWGVTYKTGPTFPRTSPRTFACEASRNHVKKRKET